MKIHMVAVGGSVMHNLALDLQAAGHQVTGSDDEFYEPSKSRLAAAGILPDYLGWNPAVITADLDCVITGMHARKDNPEIARALELNLPIYSFPEFFGQRCNDKLRIVVAGSHGKTTTTAMIMHALREAGRNFDYLVGAALEGFERNVRLTDAPLVVIEGDEYPGSPLDLRPKIMHYDPHITIITGVAWDHMNVFPTWEKYVEVFRDYLDVLQPGTTVIWYADDPVLSELMQEKNLHSVPYRALPLSDSETYAVADEGRKTYPLQVFGTHNLQNMSAALQACLAAGISKEVFLQAMTSFQGASMRLQLLFAKDNLSVYRDFAHAPSKVKATVNAVRERFPGHTIIACFELHTFSSLNGDFLPEYAGSMDAADHAMIFYSPKTLEIKKMAPVSQSQITDAFAHPSLEVMTSKKMLEERLNFFRNVKTDTIILLMSSGRFEHADLQAIFS